MREIKFRAWDKENKEMFRVVMLAGDTDDRDNLLVSGRGGTIQGAPLMQYTGRKDKNGKEIYEGDVVIWGGGQYEIVFSKDGGAWILKDDREDYDCPALYPIRSPKQSRIKVIGNIFEDKKDSIP